MGKGMAGNTSKAWQNMEVETDTHKLVTQVCGANYQLDSEPIMIKVGCGKITLQLIQL